MTIGFQYPEPRKNADFIVEAALQPDAIKYVEAGNASGFQRRDTIG